MGKYETPEYEILLKEDDFEIRKYLDFFIVEYENTADPKMDDGFGSLFKYISSDNKENEKISMTVPVISQEQDKQSTMAFVVPSKFGDKIPEPNNPNIYVKKFEEGLFGTIRYSGTSKDSKQAKMRDKLGEWILDQGYQNESNYMKASYDGPYVLPMMRRNEVWVRISKVEE